MYECLFKERWIQSIYKKQKPKRMKRRMLRGGNNKNLLQPFFRVLNDYIYEEIKQMNEESDYDYDTTSQVSGSTMTKSINESE